MDGIYQLVFGGNNANGEFGQNVAHYSVHGTSGSDTQYHTARELATQWWTAVQAAFESACGDDVQLNVLSCKMIYPTIGPTAFVPISGTGSFGSDSDTFATAIDIRILPGGSGNRAGHWFFWGVPVGVFLQGVVTPSYTTTILSVVSALELSINVFGGTANIGTYTRKTNGFVLRSAMEVQLDRATGMNKRTVPVL